MGQARINREKRRKQLQLSAQVSEPGFAKVDAVSELFKLEDRKSPIKISSMRVMRPGEYLPNSVMSKQQLRAMGKREIERKLRAMYPGAERRVLRAAARVKFFEAWSSRDKAAIAKAVAERTPEGLGVGMRRA